MGAKALKTLKTAEARLALDIQHKKEAEKAVASDLEKAKEEMAKQVKAAADAIGKANNAEELEKQCKLHDQNLLAARTKASEDLKAETTINKPEGTKVEDAVAALDASKKAIALKHNALSVAIEKESQIKKECHKKRLDFEKDKKAADNAKMIQTSQEQRAKAVGEKLKKAQDEEKIAAERAKKADAQAKEEDAAVTKANQNSQQTEAALTTQESATRDAENQNQQAGSNLANAESATKNAQAKVTDSVTETQQDAAGAPTGGGR